MTRLSVVLPYWQDRPPEEALEIARLAAELGYPELWLGEMATFDAFALATRVGADTALDLTIGPLAVGVRTAVTMAMGVASVSTLIGRPVRLAIGASSPAVVDRWHGRPWVDTARHLAETAAIVRTLLEGGRTDHDGARSASHGFRLRLQPPGCHLTVAAFGPAALQVAARHGDRVVLNMVTSATVAAVAEKLSRGERRPTLAVWLTASVNPTPEDHRQLARARAAYVGVPGYGEMIRAAGFGELVDLARSGAPFSQLVAAIPPELADVVGICGDAAHLRRRIGEYAAAGADEICLVPTTAGPSGARPTLEALASAGAGTS